MWKYRELLSTLTIADLKFKYQNTSLGFFWSILSPFLYAFVLYVVFRGLFAGEKDYVSNLLVGIMMWRFFSMGTLLALNGFISKPSLITKVYLPRQTLVLSSVLSTLISSTLEFIILLPIILILRGSVPPTVILFSPIHIIMATFIYGVGLFLASIYVFFRDVYQIWDVLLNILMFCSPIFYPVSIVPQYMLFYYMANPITRLLIMYRDVMIAGQIPTLNNILVTIGFAIGAYFLGTLTFNKLQRRFAEEI
jgi:lipopolysaccharide transport system permease protein